MPPGPMVRHVHHMVPRAYGGVDGPTITLCDSDHNTLHKIAVALKANKSYYTHLQGADSEQRRKLVYLANIVYNAELETRNDPNKSASAMVTLTARHKFMVDKLKKVYPSHRSREAVLLIALEKLFNQHFG